MKKLMLVLAAAGFSSLAFAQGWNNANNTGIVVEESTDVMEVPVSKYSVETNSFWSNWFLDFGAGAQVMFDDYSDHGKFKKRIAPAFNVSIGKWFTPGLGLRLQFSGFQAKSYSPFDNDYSTGARDADGLFKMKFNYMNLHDDILFNVSNMLAGYNEHRVYDFIPYVGFGFNHSFDTPHLNTLSANFGIINTFHLTRAWDLNLELNGMVTEDRFDGIVEGKAADLMIGASLGFAFKFPQRGFKHTPDINAMMALSASQLDAVNAALADQIEQNNMLKQQLANKPKEVVTQKVVVKEAACAPQSIFFEIGSSMLPANSEVNLKAIADVMKATPDLKMNLTGYADSNTGSPAWNKQLSENRAKAVADALVKMGIDKSRLNIMAKGGVDMVNPYQFNRRVIVEAQQ